MSKKAFGSAAIVGLALMDGGTAMATPPVYDWSGFYVGGNVGGAWQKDTFSNFATGSISPSSFIIGAYAGYNWQLPSNVVLGLEGGLDLTNLNGNLGILTYNNNWIGSVRGRIGYSFGAVLPYAGLNASVGHFSENFPGLFSNNTRFGWGYQAGVEVALGKLMNGYSALRSWTVRAEWRHTCFGKSDFFDGEIRTKIVTNTFMLGLSTPINLSGTYVGGR